jgi:hypothetical protein
MRVWDLQPLACCLSTGGYQNRTAWTEAVTPKALRGHDRDDLVQHLSCWRGAKRAATDVLRVPDIRSGSTLDAVSVTKPRRRPREVSADTPFEQWQLTAPQCCMC